MEKNQRNSSLEVLRIISTLLIVSWHYSIQFSGGSGGILGTKISMAHVFAIILGSWGQVGVNLFAIIGISFLSKRNTFKTGKAIELVLETIFYGMIWAVIGKVFLGLDISIVQIIKSVFTIITGAHWFILAYLLLYIFSPTLNGIINKCSISFLKRTTILLTVFVCAMKTIYTDVKICDFLFLVNLYFVYNTIERTGLKEIISKNAGKWLLISVISMIGLNVCVSLIATGINNHTLLQHSIYLNHRGSVLMLIISFFAFYYAEGKRKFSSRCINLVASTSLGVYLSHQGVAGSVWKSVIVVTDLSGITACIQMIESVVLIYTFCVFLDIIRQVTIGKLIHSILCCSKISFRLSKCDRYMNQDI